jgi:hypothetical protein
MPWGHCWNTLLHKWELRPLLEHIVATLGAEVIVGTQCCNIGNQGHCCNSEKWGHRWLTTMTSDHIATMDLDTVVAFDTIVAFVITFK